MTLRPIARRRSAYVRTVPFVWRPFPHSPVLSFPVSALRSFFLSCLFSFALYLSLSLSLSLLCLSLSLSVFPRSRSPMSHFRSPSISLSGSLLFSLSIPLDFICFVHSLVRFIRSMLTSVKVLSDFLFDDQAFRCWVVRRDRASVGRFPCRRIAKQTLQITEAKHWETYAAITWATQGGAAQPTSWDYRQFPVSCRRLETMLFLDCFRRRAVGERWRTEERPTKHEPNLGNRPPARATLSGSFHGDV